MIDVKRLTEKQLYNRLEKYYKEYFGKRNTDEWFINPADNKWKFMRDEKIYVLICDIYTGIVEQKSGIKF